MVDKQIPHRDLVKEGLPRKGEAKPQDDQITVDIKKAKEFKDEIVGKVKEQISPVVSQATPKITSAAQPVKSLFKGEFIKKILKIAAILFLIIIFLYIISLFVKNIRENGEISQNGLPTPTLIPYLPYNPSVYADDELVLELEEDINVLDRELSPNLGKQSSLHPFLILISISKIKFI